MSILRMTPELKVLLLFSGAGIAVGGVSVLLARASIAGILGIGVLYVLRKSAMKMTGMDAAAMMQNGVMPYLTFWFAVWVILINV